MVGNGDPVGTASYATAAQVGVSFAAGRRLETLTRETVAGDVQPIRGEGHAKALGDRPGLGGSSIRRRVEGVIEVGGADAKIVPAGEFVESPEQSGRVGTAGERDDDLAAGLERSVQQQKALDMVDERLAQCPLR
jgi:hypothetical protein